MPRRARPRLNEPVATDHRPGWQPGSATEPGAKDSSDRRPQPSRPIIGWLGRGEIAFAKFSGEDGDMTCVEHRQAVDIGNARQRDGRRVRKEHRCVAKRERPGKLGTEAFMMDGESPRSE